LQDLDDVDLGTSANSGADASATDLAAVYDTLVGHGFQQQDVQGALTALKAADTDAALDWLCMHVPPERLPKRFAGAVPATCGDARAP
jgi:uncharacterized UBP type Zn finger protein